MSASDMTRTGDPNSRSSATTEAVRNTLESLSSSFSATSGGMSPRTGHESYSSEIESIASLHANRIAAINHLESSRERAATTRLRANEKVSLANQKSARAFLRATSLDQQHDIFMNDLARRAEDRVATINWQHGVAANLMTLGYSIYQGRKSAAESRRSEEQWKKTKAEMSALNEAYHTELEEVMDELNQKLVNLGLMIRGIPAQNAPSGNQATSRSVGQAASILGFIGPRSGSVRTAGIPRNPLELPQDARMIPEFKPALEDSSRSSAVPFDLMWSMANVESGFKVHDGSKVTASPKGALGVFQFMPGTAKDEMKRLMGESIDPTDPIQSAAAAPVYMRYLLDLPAMVNAPTEEERVRRAVAAYNAGEGNIGKAVSRYQDKWLENLHLITGNDRANETRDYLKRVMGGFELDDEMMEMIFNGR